MKTIETIIIGAGPAGLATAARLRKFGLNFEVLEQSDKVANAWHNHYDRLCLHTVKQFSNLPYVPFPKEFPLYVPRLELVQYLEDYAKQFDIKPYFNHKVTAVNKADNGKWLVETANEASFLADNVVIATGTNHTPNVPTWQGQEQYQGEIMHTRFYKNPKPYLGKKVLVIGMGNTGAEIALDLSEHDVDVAISIRNPICITPRDVNGRPAQVTAKQLQKLPKWLAQWIAKQVRNVVIGDLTKYGVPISKMDPVEQLLTTGKTPVVDLGTAKHIKEGRIKIFGEIAHFNPTDIQFKDGKQQDFDVVLLATGYHAEVDKIVEKMDNSLDKYNLPKEKVGTAYHEGLYFVGYDNYKLGGLLGTIFTDSETIAEAIQERSVTI